jgi:hypothetical protein
MKMKKRAAVIAIGALWVLSARAETLFSTDFSGATQAGGSGTAITMGGTAASGVTVSAMTAGAGVVNFQIDSVSTAGKPEAPVFAAGAIGNNPSTTLSEAIANQEYFQFTLSSETALTLTGVSFKMVKHGTPVFAGITLRSSIDNYTSDLVTVTDSMATGIYPAHANLSLVPGFSGISSVTFRFYLYDAYTGQNNRRLGVDDLIIESAGSGQVLGLYIISSL